MPDFELPIGAPELLDRVELLNVSFDVDIEPQWTERVDSLLAGKRSVHADHRRRVQFGTKLAELWGVIGVHRDPRDGAPNDVYLHGHVRLERRPARADASCTDDVWSELSSFLKELMVDSPAEVNMRLMLPSEGTVTAVTLPIEFGAGDVAGFSEIRGVQLVQTDPDDEEKALYSVILQRAMAGLSVAVQTSASIDLNSNTLGEAFGKAMDVARLAVPSMEAR